MQNWWISWKMAQIKQEEILKQAAGFRSLRGHLRKSLIPRDRTPKGSLPILYSLGAILVRWGNTLQARHGAGVRA